MQFRESIPDFDSIRSAEDIGRFNPEDFISTAFQEAPKKKIDGDEKAREAAEIAAMRVPHAIPADAELVLSQQELDQAIAYIKETVTPMAAEIIARGGIPLGAEEGEDPVLMYRAEPARQLAIVGKELDLDVSPVKRFYPSGKGIRADEWRAPLPKPEPVRELVLELFTHDADLSRLMEERRAESMAQDVEARMITAAVAAKMHADSQNIEPVEPVTDLVDEVFSISPEMPQLEHRGRHRAGRHIGSMVSRFVSRDGQREPAHLA